jgi:hypothetical protein
VEILHVEDPFRDPAKEPRHSILENLATRAQHRRAGREYLAERQQIVLVAAGAVQEKEREAGIGASGFDEAMVEEIERRGSAGGCHDCDPLSISER